MIPLVVIRPEPGCSATLAAARKLGLVAQGFPLFGVVARAWQQPDAGAVDALLAGSANAFRLGGPALMGLRNLPVHAVGETTAKAAREAGFAVAATGAGGLQAVLDAVPEGTRLLRLAGEERVPLVPPSGVSITERIVYASEPRAMPAGLAGLLRSGAAVLLHSGVAARHFAAECERLAIPRGGIRLAALAPRIAQAAEDGWAAVGIAASASDADLLALAAQLCQSNDNSRG